MLSSGALTFVCARKADSRARIAFGVVLYRAAASLSTAHGSVYEYGGTTSAISASVAGYWQSGGVHPDGAAVEYICVDWSAGALNVSPAANVLPPSCASASTVFCAPSLKPTTPTEVTPGRLFRYLPAARTSCDSFQPKVCSQFG